MVNYLKPSFVDHTRARGQVQVFADHCAWTLIDGKAGGQKRGKKEDTDPHTASDFELRSLTSKSSDNIAVPYIALAWQAWIYRYISVLLVHCRPRFHLKRGYRKFVYPFMGPVGYNIWWENH